MNRFKSVKAIALFLFVTATTAMMGQTNVTDAELQKFATAFQKVQMENQKAQQDMMKVIQEEGMETQRFVEIQQAQSDPNQEVEATADEMESFNRIASNIEEMQPAITEKMEGHVTSSGLKVDRYQAIATQLQNSAELQNRLKAMLQ